MRGFSLRGVLLLVLVLIVAGCGGGGSDNTSDPEIVSGTDGDPDSAPESGDTPPDPGPPTGDSGGSGQANLPMAFDVGVTYTREIFVAPAGSDTEGDGSATAPYRSIATALSRATPGTRVRVAAGTYAALGSFSGLQGTSDAPIALVGEGAVIIDGGGSSQALQLSDPRYVVLEGLTIQNTVPHGINIDDGGDYASPAEFVVVRNVHFRDVGNGGNNDCLKMSGVDHFFVTASEFEGCNQGEAIDMVGCHDGVVSGNYFHDIPRNAVQTKGGSADVLIHGNRFVDISQRAVNAGGSTGLQFFRPLDAPHEGARIQVVANTFLRTGSAPIAFVGCDTCVFANNTIVQPRSYVARILEENTVKTAGTDGYFINNLIVFNVGDLSSYSYVNVGSFTQPETYVFGSNLWFALDQALFSGPVYNGGVPAEVDSVIQEDPLLTDLSGGDYRLLPDSPAVARGRAVPRGVPADFEGDAYADPPAIGAFAAP